VSVELQEQQPLNNVRIRGVLQLRELKERLRQQLYTVHDMIEEDGQIIVENWMNYAHQVVEPLVDVLPEEIEKHKGRP